jgi:lipoprotein
MVKMRSVMWVAASVAMFGLAGCASAPVSYHTLQGSSEAGSGTSAQPDLRYQIAAVNVPERLNRPDLVLSGTPETAGKPGGADAGGGQVRADTSVTVLENERWDASLTDALRDALAARLAEAAARPVTPASAREPARLRLTVQVYRFDASQRGDVDVLADWRLRRLDIGDEDDASPEAPDGRVLACRYQGRATVPAGSVTAVVSALQQQVVHLADDIVAATRPWLRGSAQPCAQGALQSDRRDMQGAQGMNGMQRMRSVQAVGAAKVVQAGPRG